MSKLAILTLEYPPYKGGVARFISEVAAVEKINCTTIFSPAFINGNKIAYNDKRIIRYTLPHYFWPRWLFLFIKLLFSSKTWDYFIASAVLPLGTIAYLLNLFKKKPYTVFVYGMDILQLKKNSWKFFLARRILKRADKVIVISAYTKSLLKRFNVEKSRVTILYPQPFCTPEKFIPCFPKTLTDNIKNKKVFLSVGRLVERKNFDTIISVASKLTHRTDIHFVIVGNGPKYDLIKKRAAQVSNVTLLPCVTDNELAWLYSNCRAVIFIPVASQIDVEGFGITAIEASAFSKPVIASQTGGVVDAVENNISGIFVHPFNLDEISLAITRFADDDNFAKKIGLSGKQRYEEKFSNTSFIKKVGTLFSSPTKIPVSIIIPAYNAKNTIYECLDSIYQQSSQPEEIIVVDDGSHDGTSKIILSNFPGVIVLQQNNQGAPSARNKGAERSTQPYLLFVDSDMKLHPRMLEKEYRTLLLNPDIDFTYSSFKFGWKKFRAIPFNPEKLKKYNYIHTSSLLKRSAFPGFDTNLKRHQDWDLWLTINRRGGKGLAIPEVFYEIHTEKNRISHWLPSFIYRIPFADFFFPQLRRYNESAIVIKKKHKLP